MKCGKCGLNFPSELLSEMCVNGVYTPPICGICALDLRNRLHGLPQTNKFQGEVAKEMYKKTLDYIKAESNDDCPHDWPHAINGRCPLCGEKKDGH